MFSVFDCTFICFILLSLMLRMNLFLFSRAELLFLSLGSANQKALKNRESATLRFLVQLQA